MSGPRISFRFASCATLVLVIRGSPYGAAAVARLDVASIRLHEAKRDGAMPMADEPTGTVSVRVLSRMLDLSARRLQQLSDDGYIPKTGRGRYPLEASVLAYVRYLRRQDYGPEAVEDYQEAKARKTSAEADLAEMAAAQRRGELVEADVVDREAQTVMLEIRTRMLSVAHRVTPRIVGETNERRVRAEIEREIEEGLTVLADQAEADDDELDTAELDEFEELAP